MRTLFLSREEVKNPLVDEIKRAGKIVKEKGLVEGTYGNISVRYGKRIVITAANSDLGKLSNDDIVEVVDYNPATDVAMVIGLKEPSTETPMHWLIYRRDDINAIIHVHATFEEAPTSEKYAKEGTLELAMEAIKALKNSKIANLMGHGSIAVGINMEEALKVLKCL